MKSISAIPILLALMVCEACAQPNSNSSTSAKSVGGGCDGCTGIYDNAPSFAGLGWTDTLPDFGEKGPKLIVYGTLFQSDGKTPAPNVILYIYHTDQKGHYTPSPSQSGQGRRHGYIRGWIKSGADGKYKFYTLKPAPYPGNSIPAHIHPIVKEPGINEYYIDEFVFSDDPFVDERYRSRQECRGGCGIITLTKSADGTLLCKRDIVLGKNIPNYK